MAGLGAAFAPWATACAQGAGGLTENDVSFAAPGGTMDAFFVHPGEGKHPAVIIWPDIAGLRDAFKAMGRRLASAGYSVLVANPFYRSAPAPQFKDFEDFRASGGFQKVGPWMAQNTHDDVTETAQAVVAWLDQQAAVDTAKGIGNQGYCMGGPFTVRTAAAVPARVKAAASFHGGGLVARRRPTAPIKLLPQTQASYLIAIAKNDDAQRAGREGRAQGSRRRRRPPGGDRGLPGRPRLDRGRQPGLQRGRGRARLDPRCWRSTAARSSRLGGRRVNRPRRAKLDP